MGLAARVEPEGDSGPQNLPHAQKELVPGESLTMSIPWTPTDEGAATLSIFAGAPDPDLTSAVPVATLVVPLVGNDRGVGRPSALPGPPDGSRAAVRLGPRAVACRIARGAYAPAEVSARPGQAVTWINGDSAAHTVTSGTPSEGPDGMFDSGLLVPGSSFAYRLRRKGRYRYFCIVHPWECGAVTVL